MIKKLYTYLGLRQILDRVVLLPPWASRSRELWDSSWTLGGWVFRIFLCRSAWTSSRTLWERLRWLLKINKRFYIAFLKKKKTFILPDWLRACICCSKLCCILIPNWSSWSHCCARPTVECSVYLLSKIRCSSNIAPEKIVSKCLINVWIN